VSETFSVHDAKESPKKAPSIPKESLQAFKPREVKEESKVEIKPIKTESPSRKVDESIEEYVETNIKPEVVLSTEFEVHVEKAGDQSVPANSKVNKDIGNVVSPKHSAGNSTVLMGSVVPKQPTVKPATIGGLSKTIDKTKP
jgi:hypothetical protein